MIVMYVSFIALSMTFTNLLKSYYPEFNKTEFIRAVLLAVFTFLFVLTPIHEVLHLAGSARDFLGKNSYLVIGPFAVGAFYAGEMTRKRLCFSLILPFVAIAAIIIAAIIFTSGNILYFLFCLLWCHTLGCGTDIYMFFYYCFSKKFSSKTRIFGSLYLNKQ